MKVPACLPGYIKGALLVPDNTPRQPRKRKLFTAIGIGEIWLAPVVTIRPLGHLDPEVVIPHCPSAGGRQGKAMESFYDEASDLGCLSPGQVPSLCPLASTEKGGVGGREEHDRRQEARQPCFGMRLGEVA